MLAGPAVALQRTAAPAARPQFQGNAAHTGFEPGEKSVTWQNVRNLSVAWTASLTVPSNSEVVVTGGVAYAPAGDTVTAFDAADGTQLWQVSLPGNVLGTPAVQSGRVLVAITVGSGLYPKGFVLALDSATGATVWSRQVGTLASSVTATPDRVYVSDADGQVVALGIGDGYRIWKSVALPGCTLSDPSIANGLVVVGGGGEYVSALHASDGTVAWQDTFRAGCAVAPDNWVPAISQGTVYAGLLDGVAALTLTSGAVVWQDRTIQDVASPLSVTSSQVLASPDSVWEIAGLNRSDGSQAWQASFSREVGEIGGTATFGSLAWALVRPGENSVKAIAIGPRAGNRAYTSPVSYGFAHPLLPPVVDAGHVYVIMNKKLLCLALPIAG